VTRVKAVTITEVAEAAGVSTATVSRVVNGDERVSVATAAKTKRAIDELGYKANQVARSLKTRATMTIGVVAPELASDFFMLLAESMDRYLSARGYSLIVCSSRENADHEARRLRFLSNRLVDGIVMIPATSHGGPVREIQDKGIPIVFIDRMAADTTADAVLVDNVGGAREATEALIADGYKRIGFLGANLEVTTARERYTGYCEAMTSAGLVIEANFARFGSLHIDSGYRLMEEMLSRPDAPEAYFIVNAENHVGATNYLMTAGRAHRDRVVFASFDEMPYSPLLQYCRYSVSQPIGEMGEQAARMLLGRIGSGVIGFPEIARLKTTLIRH
jgi:LacI family transcriptional regulator